MAQLNNPAGRLHALLTEFREVGESSNNPSVLTIWNEVLGTESSPETLAAVARVSALLPGIEKALVATGDPEQSHAYAVYVREWAMAVLTPNQTWSQSGNGLIEEGPLATLGSISSFLSQAHPEGTVPTEEQQDELRTKFAEALDTLRGSTSLPDKVRTQMVRRFHDMLWALDHLDVEGPDGVKAAVERLASNVQMQPKAVQEEIAKLDVLPTAFAAWVIFTSSPTIHAALEAWPKVFGYLPG